MGQKNYQCPYCQHHLTLIEGYHEDGYDNEHSNNDCVIAHIPSARNKYTLNIESIVCNNPKCDKLSLKVESKNTIDPPIWKAISKVREMGAIGAHMEKDVNLMIDVNPDEAKTLITLIEMLMKNWYIAKHEQEQSLENLVKMPTREGKKQEAQEKTSRA